MNTRFLTVLSLLAFLACPAPAAAHPCQDELDDHKHCRGGNDDGGAEYYDVTITGAVAGDGKLWEYDGRSIDLKGVNRHIDASASLDLTYFSGKFMDENRDLITECFGSAFDDVDLHSAGVLKRRRSDAHGKFWFEGFTYEVDWAERRQVLYLLIVDGVFASPGAGGWPENGALMKMSDWELKVENAGGDIANRSCEGSGTVTDFMKISVDLASPDP